MLQDMIKNFVPVTIGGEEFRLRYSLNSELCLEVMYIPLRDILQKPFDDWTNEDILQLLRAGFCDLPENRSAVNSRDFGGVQPDLATLGAVMRREDRISVIMSILDAISASFPSASEDAGEAPADQDEGDLYAFCVYKMGMSPEEFWGHTERELQYHMERYARINTPVKAAESKEPEIIIKEIDDT